MTDPKLDARLKSFLETSEQDRAAGNTIENLRLEIGQLQVDMREQRTEHMQLKYRVDRHGRDISELKRKAGDDDNFDTGQHQVEDLRKALANKESELKERKEEGLWWKRSAVKWIVGGVAWVFTTIVAAFAASTYGRK